MLSIPRWVRSTGFLLLISPLAVAQTNPKPLPAPQLGSEILPRPLLMESMVQKDIGLTPKQRNSLAQIQADVADSQQGAVAEAGDEGFDFNSMMVGVEDLERQRRAAIAKVLTSAQKTRLLQIEWQREGWIALGRSDVASKLKLSQPQFQKIQAILKTMRQAQMQAILPMSVSEPIAQANPKSKPNLNPSNGFIDPNGVSLPAGGLLNSNEAAFRAQAQKTKEAGEKIRDSSAKAIDEVLTPEQKTAFEKLLGPTFDFKSLKTAGPSEPLAASSPKTRKASPKKSANPR